MGYAYVNFHQVTDAERALDTMNFTEIKDRPCRIMWSQRDPSLRKSGVGNVFIKNLAPTVDNKNLYDIFSVFGNILSCKVATDENGASKGYGYVHYETAESAEDAIQKINGMAIDDIEVHVCSFVRRHDRPGQADWTNLYVKQFPESYDEAKLMELFSAYPGITSVKVIRSEDGKSRCFGFLNFSDHVTAEKCFHEMNDKVIEDPSGSFTLYVSRAQKKLERSREIKSRMDAMRHDRIGKFQGMNLYVKNLDDDVTDDELKSLFAVYGTITSARLMRTEDGTSRGFGFVCFSSPEEASRAVSELNNKMVRSKPIFVTLHQKKEQRRAHLAATYGSRMNGVSMTPGFGPTGAMPPFMMMGQHPGAMPGQPPRQPYAMIPPNMMQNPRGMPRGMPYSRPMAPTGGAYSMMPFGMQGQQGGAPNFKRPPPMNGQGQMQGQMQPQMQGQGPPMMRRPMGGRGGMMPQGPPGRGPPVIPQGRLPVQGGGPGGLKYTAQARNQPIGPNGMPIMMGGPQSIGQPQQGAAQHSGMAMQTQADTLDHMLLAESEPSTQKNMIGERLYPLISDIQPELAGKITGMLLEMDNAELLHLLESPESLMSKVEEAMAVLRSHQGVAVE